MTFGIPTLLYMQIYFFFNKKGKGALSNLRIIRHRPFEDEWIAEHRSSGAEKNGLAGGYLFSWMTKNNMFADSQCILPEISV